MNNQITPRIDFTELLSQNSPDAAAWINGNAQNPGLSGMVKFYRTIYGGVLIEAEIFGLPNAGLPGSSNFYAMHIHESGDCSDDFDHTGMHYNPKCAEHPNRACDLPPLLGSQGYAYSVFYDKRFTLSEISEKAVIIHEKPDDFTSQPSGNAGAKIGCGEIRALVPSLKTTPSSYQAP